MAFASTDWVDSTMEEQELKGLLDFAGHTLEDPGRAWSEFTLDQQQRYQRILFPKELTCERAGELEPP